MLPLRLLLGSFLSLLSATQLWAATPNVVFFLVDDLGYMDIGANNAETFYETPNVDRLASLGVPIRMGRWKLIERFEDGTLHLYDLQEDVGERNDVAAKHPERVGEMRDKLHAWYRDVDAKFLQPRPDGPQPWRPSTGEDGR